MWQQVTSVPGLDPGQFRSQQQYQREDEADNMLGVALQLTDEERYKDCEHFTFTCPQCSTDNICDSVFEGTVSSKRSRWSLSLIITKIVLLKGFADTNESCLKQLQ